MAKYGSIQPRKQRLAAAVAPLHQRHRKLAAHFAEPLIIRYNRRSFPVVRGDTVKVMRGVYRGHEEKIASVDLKSQKVTVEGVTAVKADGTKVARPVDTSNLLITKLNLTDPRRRDRLTSAAKVDEETRKKLAKELEDEAKAQEAEIREFTERLAAEEAERKAKAREEGELEAAIDPVTQEPMARRKREEIETIEEVEGEDEEERPRELAKAAPPDESAAVKEPTEPANAAPAKEKGAPSKESEASEESEPEKKKPKADEDSKEGSE